VKPDSPARAIPQNNMQHFLKKIKISRAYAVSISALFGETSLYGVPHILCAEKFS